MTIKHIFSVSVASVSVALIIFLANFALTFVPRDHFKESVTEAFKSGGLPTVSPANSPLAAPKYNHNDCLILGMLLPERSEESRLQRAISPKEVRGVGRSINPMCEDTRYAISNRDINSNHYHNYIHAYWTLAGVLMTVLSFYWTTLLLWSVSLALIVSLIVLNLASFRNTRSPSSAAYAGLGIGALLFTGRSSYGWSLSFNPSDIVLLSFLLAWSVGRARGALGSAFFGALTASFEFFTGALPIAAAFLILDCALSHTEGGFRRAFRRFGIFGLSFLGLFAIKAAVVAMAFSPVETADAGGKLIAWSMSGNWEIDSYNAAKLSSFSGVSIDTIKQSRIAAFGFALAKMAYFSPGLMFGSVIAGLVTTVVLPAALTFFCLWRAMRGDRRSVLILASAFAIIGWHLIFVSHTIVHAYFMVRTLGWLGCSALAVLGWELATTLRDKSADGGMEIVCDEEETDNAG